MTAQPKANTVVPARVNSVVQPSAARGAASTTPVSAGRVSVRPSSVVQLATFNTVNGVTAGIPARIRANNTPDAMPNRIPPRVDTPTRLLIHGWRIPMAPLRVRVAGCSQQNGVVTVNGQAEARISADCYLQLRGVTQTQPGHAGNLMLEVLLSEGPLLARSDGFSVAAIPQNWSVTGWQPTDEEGFVGLDIQDEWESDSGQLGDLDEVQITEVMETVTKTGCCMGLPERDSGYIIAHEVSIDAHAIRDEYMTGPGRWVVNQTHAFRDRRTGANGISMANSGYRITLEVKKKPSSSAYQVTVTKEGAALTVRGVSSGAGAGIISQTVG